MPRHFADQSTAQYFFASSDYCQDNYCDATTIRGSHPGYHLQSRGRRENFQSMKQREPLREGFGVFLSETETNDKIGDAARRHFRDVCGVESKWKPCVHAVPAVERQNKPQGKRFGHEEPQGAGVEYGDVPRGMKHISPPRGQLQDEMPLFAISRGRVYNQDGVNLSNAQSLPSESSYSEHAQRRHGKEGDRNGLPQRNPGDKSNAAVEYSPHFFDRGVKHRLDLEAPTKPFVKENRFAEKEAQNALQKDRMDVASLPKYPKSSSSAPLAATAAATTVLPPVGKK